MKHQPNESVLNELKKQLLALPEDSPHFDATNPPDAGTYLRADRECNDARKFTWTKSITNMAKHVSFQGGEQDCFLSTYADSGTSLHKPSDYVRMKFGGAKSSKRNQQNVTVHRIAAALKFPDRLLDLEGTGEDDERMTVSHLCGNATCFRHLCLETLNQNNDRKGCKYGCFDLCPHLPKCIWADENGKANWRNTPEIVNKPEEGE